MKRSRRRPRLAAAMHKQLLPYAMTGNYLGNEMVQKLELPIKGKRVQENLKSEEFFQYPDHVEVRTILPLTLTEGFNGQ